MVNPEGMAPNTFEHRAFLGERANNPDYERKVDETAKKINVMFGSVDTERNKITVGIITELTGDNFGNVDGLKNVINEYEKVSPPSKTQKQAEIADGYLQILTDATFIAMRHGGKKELQDALAQGPGKIDEILPRPLKGLGERVAENIITDETVLKVLDSLEKQRNTLKKMGSLGKNMLADQVENAAKQLIGLSMSGGATVNQDQVTMVAAYLSGELDEMRGVVGTNVARARELMPMVPQMGKDAGSTEGGAQYGAQMALSEIGYPKDRTKPEVDKWILETTDSLARGTLFWSGQWQQYGQELERRIQAMFINVQGGEKEMAVNKRYLQAILACRIQEQAILHCDGTPGSYSKMLPPPGELPDDYTWKDTVVDKVQGIVRDGEKNETEVGLVGELRRDIREMAYNQNEGEKVVKCLKNADSINEWAEDLAKPFENVEACAKEKARVAIALFIVEDYAKWLVWSSKISVEPKGLEKVPWMKAKTPRENATNESCVWQKRVMDSKGTLGWVQVWGANFAGAKNETCVQHPYVQFMRPVDLYRFKSSWNEELLGELGGSLHELALRKFVYNEDEKMKDGGVENMLKPSNVGLKDFNRWNLLVDKWVGGSQAEGLDNFKTWLEGAEQLKALLQTRKDVFHLGGRIAAEIFLCKVKAFMSMKDTSFLKDLSNVLGTDPFDVREFQAARGDLLGSGGAGEFGQIFEAMARINLNIANTKEYEQAHAMLMTGVNDPEEALKMLIVKKGAIWLQTVSNVAGAFGGKKK